MLDFTFWLPSLLLVLEYVFHQNSHLFISLSRGLRESSYSSVTVHLCPSGELFIMKECDILS